MDTNTIFNFCLDIFAGFKDFTNIVVGFLKTTIVIGSTSFPLIAVIFGAGIAAYFTVALIKWAI